MNDRLRDFKFYPRRSIDHYFLYFLNFHVERISSGYFLSCERGLGWGVQFGVSLSVLVETCPNMSKLVQTSVVICGREDL